MSGDLRGADDLRARLKALTKNVAKPAHKEWADEAVKIAKDAVGRMNMPYSGAKRKRPQAQLLPSIRRKTATQKKAVVVASYHAYFVDHGVKAHSLQSRKSRPKSSAGRTVFSRAARKPHPGYAARPFRVKTTMEAFHRVHPLDKVVMAWNEAR